MSAHTTRKPVEDPLDQRGLVSLATKGEAIDPVLIRFRAALDEIYGDQIERVILFGSRARGDARPESDYDVAVFLRHFHDRWSVVDRLTEVVTDILYDDGVFIHAMPYREGAYRDRTPLMHEIRREGLDL